MSTLGGIAHRNRLLKTFQPVTRPFLLIRLDWLFSSCTAEELGPPALRSGSMDTVSEVTTLPAEVGKVPAEADRIGEFEKNGEKSGTDEENTKSDGEGSVIDVDAVEDRGKYSRMIPDSYIDFPLHHVALICIDL